MSPFKNIPVFIITRDRVSCLEQLIDWLESVGMTSINLLDNASTYPPMLEYLDSSPHTIIRNVNNSGHLLPWMVPAVQRITQNFYYIVTDPDILPIETCPDDAVEHLFTVLSAHPDHVKAGLGLKIDDLPDCYAHKRSVIGWESKFWNNSLGEGLHEAGVDTTFALYRPGTPYCREPAIRTGGPYLARHLPWYIDSENLTEEERYYRAHLETAVSTWNQETLADKYSECAGDSE